MNNNNKILTVSYGTFSCTLEGFDDSFDTMKAIAEYFRDLAADDRYFGAEPPQPDADMLARIAQREVSRRVEAHEHDGRIMLKAHQEPADPVSAAPDDSIAQQPEPVSTKAPVLPPVAVRGAEETPAQPQAEEDTLDVEDAPDGEDANAQDIAEHDDEIETAQAPFDETSEPEEPQVPVAEETTDLSEDESADSQDDYVVDDLEDTLIDVDEPAPETEISAQDETPAAEEILQEDTTELPETTSEDHTAVIDDVAAFFAESSTTQAPDMGTEEEVSPTGFAVTAAQDEDAVDAMEVDTVEARPAGLSSESLAEKLKRIRAVVSENTDDAPEAEFVEDIEEPAAAQDFDDISAFVSETSAGETDYVETSEDEPNEFIAEAAQDISDAFEIDDSAVDSKDSAETFDEEDELDALLRRIEAKDDTLEDDSPVDLVAEIDEEEEPAENLFADTDDEEDEASEVHGRVLKVNRADLEAALQAGDLQEYENEPSGNAAFADEDELLLQSEFAVSEDPAEDTSPAMAPTSARESLPDIDSDAGEDVSRLMAEADQQMQEPEGKTRRSAFAHLRAAVAARFADRTMDATDKSAEEAAEAYRSDLAEVVKPRRPIAKTRSERPSDSRPAPLKLVAEQRIDPETSTPRGPVSPRRVAAADDHDLDLAEDTGFATYAEERGAESLPELLEAAAAYLAYVEGHEQFSRPQLMSRVRQANGGDFTREDGLRAFGQLLRTGKIEKIKGGRFAASEAINFKPDHRAAG